ncbi:hypothetical protein [Spongiactinospora sp. 9N601]|uniref:hypothetical protein n=1 Tax=Spongiactinospora sp. 9N601 TaxID=3375149 RepID=UPI0037AA3116
MSLVSKGSERALGWNESNATTGPPSVPASEPPSPSAASPAFLGDPVKVNKITFIPKSQDNTWVVPSIVQPSMVRKLNSLYTPEGGPEAAADAMRALGAVETTESTIELELEGNRQKPVRILNMRMDADCRKPLTDTLFFSPPQGASEVVKIGFDLDRANPVARYAVEHELGPDFPPRFSGDYFADQKYVLKSEEQATFRLTARTYKKYCEYRFKLELLVNGKSAEQIIDNHGQPFRITAKISNREDEYNTWANCSAYKRSYLGGSLKNLNSGPGWWSTRPWRPSDQSC